jgi:hypothetical protein
LTIWILSAATLLLSGVMAHLRFRGLAIVGAMVLAPLPALALAMLLQADFSTPSFGAVQPALAYAVGFAVAAVIAERHLLLSAEGAARSGFNAAVLRSELPFALSILCISTLCPLLLAGLGGGDFRNGALILAAANLAATLSSTVAVWVILSILPNGEDLIARANRTREAWIRRLDLFAPILQSRWSRSVAGIFLVFVILASFGSAGLTVSEPVRDLGLACLGGAAAILALAAYIDAQDWRRALAITIVTAICLLMATWGFSSSGAVLDGTLLLYGVEVTILCFVPVAAIGAGMGRHSSLGGISFTAVTDRGPATLTACMGGVAIMLLWISQAAPERTGALLALAFAAVAALLFLPALVRVIEDFLPRRRSLAERYRTR